MCRKAFKTVPLNWLSNGDVIGESEYIFQSLSRFKNVFLRLFIQTPTQPIGPPVPALSLAPTNMMFPFSSQCFAECLHASPQYAWRMWLLHSTSNAGCHVAQCSVSQTTTRCSAVHVQPLTKHPPACALWIQLNILELRSTAADVTFGSTSPSCDAHSVASHG